MPLLDRVEKAFSEWRDAFDNDKPKDEQRRLWAIYKKLIEELESRNP